MSRFRTDRRERVGSERRPDRLVVGRLRRAWGRRGELLTELHTDWPEQRFAPGQRLQVERDGREPVTLTVKAFRVIGPGPLLAFEGVEEIDAAKGLAPAWLTVPSNDRPTLEDGDVHHAQLVGLRVVSAAGETLGEVLGVEEGPAADSVRVRLTETLGGAEVLVPLAPAICREIDLTGGRLVVDAPQGLLDPDGAIVVPPQGAL